MRLLRILFLTFILLIGWTYASTGSFLWIEKLFVKLGIDPIWDAGTMEIINWNRDIKKNGIPIPGGKRFKPKEKE